ncbi:MAG: transposase [Deltaproteobacteria bacterium]|nr:transposase [Deltaproteobacteria bacterium]
MEKMLSCKDESRGCFLCYCKKCNKYQTVPLGCNSRLCSDCGKRYTDKWAERLAKKVAKNIVHRHLTFSLPVELRLPIKENRYLQKVMSDASGRTIKKVFSKVKRKDLMHGVIGVVHPFGKDLKFNPHVHCIVTEGGFTRDGKFIQLGNYIPYDLLHKEWQYEVLTALRKYLSKQLINQLFKKYPNGFAAHVTPERIRSSRRLAQYIGRYVRHPAIASSRIEKYDGKVVGFIMKIMNRTFTIEKCLFMDLCILFYSISLIRILGW